MIKLPPLGDEVSVWMDAPPDEVWDLVSDVTRIGEFSPETFEAKWTRGSTGPEVGAYFAGHVKRNGVGPTYWSPCRVTACEPGEGLRVLGRHRRGDGQQLGLPPRAEGRRHARHGVLPARAVAADPALLDRCSGALRGRTNRKGMRTTLERMKAVVEK